MKLRVGLLAATLLGLIASAPALAQSYPSKPVKILIGFAAGGPTDVIGRILAQDMTAALGQTFVVENRTGANSLIATEAVAHSAPDGYTLLFASLSHNVNAILVKPQRYEPLKDFVPISLTAVLPLVIVAPPTAPFDTVQDLIKAAKVKPEALSYGSAGNGGSAHLAGALLETLTQTKMVHVPYRGNAPALTDVMAGRIDFMFYPMIGIADRVQQKQLKVIAAGTEKRIADFPGVPTMAESGFPGFEETAPWVGMLAPAGTPQPIVDILQREMTKSVAKPETQERLKALGAIVVANTPPQFRDFLVKDWDRWERVIKAAGVKADN